ncbi:23S rRNA (adenine(2503)-C(2))-methyltransferase RlmN [uncultured Desulfobacter sp.]|uniref:23S rRNA (adenine(2503)-C(2))-methyltransferase RlmN n=1 Tax=uncultured Desulfobacter sp. TaxID=240139 RepID=UPI0029F48E55|nr:23S rRNA (adenine(2503)-C(2))-methyltransferase RlmN [uncultured Desulfobacter sp.]
MKPMIDILSLPLDELTRTMRNDYGKGLFHAEALYREVFKNGGNNIGNAPEFKGSPRLWTALEQTIHLSPGQVEKTIEEEGLVKFITELTDGLKIESVIIPMTRHNTLCVSSQVGCKMGCKFCQTARMGFKRSLSTSEIVGQVFNARHHLGYDIKNIVFMGMGEPFDNFDRVMTAVKILNSQKGCDIALRHMTISTCGVVPGIERLAQMNLPNIRLAISINGPDDATRSALMPVNRRWPLAELKKSLEAYPLPHRGVFLFEYILIKGVNDSMDHAQKLARFIHPLPVRLNLIPYNPVTGFDHQSPSDEQMHNFAQMLTDKRVFVIKRWSRGRSVSAGCGQLGKI